MYDLSSATIRKYIRRTARIMPIPRSRKVCCIRAYSPLRTILEPFISGRFEPEEDGSKGAQLPSGSFSPNSSSILAMSSATCPRSRPSTPIVRSIDGWMLLWVISVGTVVRVTVARVRSGTGSALRPR